jgi:hypothetical protein
MITSLIKKIPPNRIIFYIITLGFLPLGFVIFHGLKCSKELSSLQEKLHNTQQLILLKEQKQSFNQMVKNFYSQADHLYIDRNLETLPLLQSELGSLEKILNSQSFTGDPILEKRYEFLSKGENRLSFIEGSIQTGDGIQETAESLAHTIEIDEKDLKEILCRIEGMPYDSSPPLSSPPQFLITDFKLNRKKNADNNETFLLNLKLIKREFL